MHYFLPWQSIPFASLLLIFFFFLIIAVPAGLMKLSMQQQYGLNFVSPGFYALSFLYLRITLSFWPRDLRLTVRKGRA